MDAFQGPEKVKRSKNTDLCFCIEDANVGGGGLWLHQDFMEREIVALSLTIAARP